MELVVLFIFIIEYFIQILRIAEFKKWWSKLIISLILGVVPLIMLPTAINMNKSFLSGVFLDKSLFYFLKTMFLLEGIYFLWLSIREPKEEFGLADHKFYHSMPFGIIALCGIYFLEIKILLLGLNIDFWFLAVILSLLIIVLLFFGSWIIKRLLPQRFYRTELSFILNLLMLILIVFII